MQTMQALDTDTTTVTGDARQYLTFLLAGTEYGVDILRVQEIRGWDAVTPLPNTPEYVRGVMDLRGTIVPIIDLRQRFGLESIAYGPTTVVVVLRVVHDHSSRVIGIVADAVSDVYNVSAAEIQPPPDCGSTIGTQVVQGLATVNNKMVIIINTDQLLNAEELAVVA
jgi:purine-binding chemotaxis protein CheW